jgi:hypothetical protein
MTVWSSYNETLVRRSEIVSSRFFDVIDSWDKELEKMNDGKKDGKKDEPDLYPYSFIQLLECIRV